MHTDFDKLVSNTIQWAKAHLDSTDYTYMCLGFVEDALEKSNGVEIFGGDSAKESAELYEAYQWKGLPAEGGFVFYDCIGTINGVKANWGHVGLALDNGQIIHAWDKVRIDDYLAVETLPVAPSWEQPKYIGWVPIERIMVGYEPKEYSND